MRLSHCRCAPVTRTRRSGSAEHINCHVTERNYRAKAVLSGFAVGVVYGKLLCFHRVRLQSSRGVHASPMY